MNKIVFIEPKAPNLHIYSQFKLPRLGLFILAAQMKKRGWDADVIYEETECIDYSSFDSVDLVGISTITSTAPRAYKIADRIRKTGTPVIMGGPHVTFLSEEALQHADFVIRGEGENPLMEFVDAWECDQDYTRVSNLSYTKNGRSFHNPAGPVIKDLDQVPFPDFGSRYTPNIRKKRQTIPVQTSRGCPFNCEFCSVTGMFGKKFRFRSTSHIIEELRTYNERNNHIFFYDDNFAANRKRLKTLLKDMIKEEFKFDWSTQVRVDIAKHEELLKLMYRAGCRTLYVGLESVNPRSLSSMKKKQTVGEIKQAVKVIQKHKIRIHGMFVYGFDEDDWQTVKQTIKFAKRTGISSSQFLILTPLPGSQFYKRMVSQKRLLFKDWSLYDAHHVVFKPAKFTLMALQKAQMISHKKFYSLKRSIKKFFQFKWIELAISHYARKLNRMWEKKNQTFLKAMDILTSKKNADVKLDYKQNIELD
ncbi:MAG: radical SAM protein [Candidatus Aminicenantes bacterium]|nr:radical SAM protein [Candidatus Aminicenantes bacterium]